MGEKKLRNRKLDDQNTRAEAIPPVSLEKTGLDSLVGYQLRCAHSIAVQTFIDFFAPEEIGWGQYSAFAAICVNEGANQKALAKGLGLDQSTLIPTLDHLEEKGWISRVRDSRDRRSIILSPTISGRAKLRRLQPLIQKHEEDLLHDLSKKEREELLSLLRKIIDKRQM